MLCQWNGLQSERYKMLQLLLDVLLVHDHILLHFRYEHKLGLQGICLTKWSNTPTWWWMQYGWRLAWSSERLCDVEFLWSMDAYWNHNCVWCGALQDKLPSWIACQIWFRLKQVCATYAHHDLCYWYYSQLLVWYLDNEWIFCCNWLSHKKRWSWLWAPSAR